MSINSVKRLSAASKRLTAGIDKSRMYSAFKDAITSTNYAYDEYDLFSRDLVDLGHEDLLLEFIIKIFEEYSILYDLQNMVADKGLSKVDLDTLIDLADMYEKYRRKRSEIILTNVINDRRTINNVLKYLTKACC